MPLATLLIQDNAERPKVGGYQKPVDKFGIVTRPSRLILRRAAAIVIRAVSQKGLHADDGPENDPKVRPQ